MKFEIKVHPGSKQEKVSGPPYEIWIRAKSERGKANQAVLEIISKHFSVPKSRIKIVKGIKSRKKLIEMNI